MSTAGTFDPIDLRKRSGDSQIAVENDNRQWS
jgi:hypothetical protein